MMTQLLNKAFFEKKTLLNSFAYSEALVPFFRSSVVCSGSKGGNRHTETKYCNPRAANVDRRLISPASVLDLVQGFAMFLHIKWKNGMRKHKIKSHACML